MCGYWIDRGQLVVEVQEPGVEDYLFIEGAYRLEVSVVPQQTFTILDRDR